MQSEFEFIKRIRDRASKQVSTDLILGIGDDAAILREHQGLETLVTVDLLVEDIDFKIEYAVPEWLGHKALAVSLSDIAAMGGAPKYSLLTLGIPPSLAADFQSFWEEFFKGYFALAEQHGVALIGGDLSSTPDRLTIDSMVMGHCSRSKAVRRNGARLGDGIYVTGTLGASAAGLKLLLHGERVNDAEATLSQSALRAHLRPDPCVEFGRLVGEAGLATSMIDISDGLAQDLAHICEESRVAAILDFDTVPIADEVRLVTQNNEDAFLFAVSGGEDFELLLTAERGYQQELFDLATRCGLQLTRAGEIVPSINASCSVSLRRGTNVEPISIRGYNHFSV